MFIITGGGSGIGRALALNLASREQLVLIVGRREKPLADTASMHPNLSCLCADVASEKGRQQIKDYIEPYTMIKGLIHNAGTIEPISPITEIKEAEWQNTMATNVEAPLFLTQLLSDLLKNGRVLNIGSGAAHFAVKGWAAYCVSKAALLMLTKCWQLEQNAIAFANVMPGIIDTDMQAMIRKASHMDDEKLLFFKTLKQEGKLISPETVALFLSWLLLDVAKNEFESQEWDIYDTSHHAAWLSSSHFVPTWE
ncbi:SDR family NAD(P)-dependent oxidoreductase [Legionella impletisoli]|uniref:SDR family NAD(P)-dependent oxidoreductase n=1 Tax=Legionella impletisoli TaxID=343510 RepID=UPI001040E832|nr:SDR family NAD(P)-dependent oxidoreductase [Legionella impletisoli]